MVNVNNIEAMKWLVTQMEKILDAHNSQLKSNEEKFESFSNGKLTDLTDTRNSILSVIAIIAAFISIIAAFFPVRLQTTVESVIIAATALSIIVTYLVILNHKNRLETLLGNVENAYNDGYISQNFMKGFLHVCGSVLYTELSPDPEQLFLLYIYYLIIQGGISYRILSEYEKSFPREMKSNSELYQALSTNLYMILINNAREQHKTYKQQLDGSKFSKLFNISKAGSELKTQFDDLVNKLIYQKSK